MCRQLAAILCLALMFGAVPQASAQTLTEGTARSGPKWVGPRANPILHLPKAAKGQQRLVIGFMSSAGGKLPKQVKRNLNAVGEEIALTNNVVLTGGCPLMPDEVVKGAKSKGGLAVAISPWSKAEDHIASKAPYKNFDVIQLTSLPFALRGHGKRPNYMGREVDNIARSDAIIIAGGRSGTLGEFANAYEERRPIGVLMRTGGITGEIKGLVKAISKAGKKPAAPIIYDSNPRRLVHRLLKAVEETRAKGIKYGPLGDG